MRNNANTRALPPGPVSPRSKFHVLLPLPPSTNNLFATVGTSDCKQRRVKTRAYREWLAAAGIVLLELRKPKALPAKVCFTIFGTVNRARDCDNFLKPLLDALVSADVLPGDSLKYVTDVRISYGGPWDAPDPRVMVSVEADPCAPGANL
jgi:hypothetical protein